ncbi:NACHT, LRR and PYD domains-containing protein 3-like [Polypterus senegalus]|uniref:NACHT, LRR and PYD domains-containing protein 3-like n=1 Tax=Polypterus senegalus TaxID=55291 RepID=UPI00196326B8|nr:NACHT, LRR and PYD domains-containing protein 3-like [Polypterus senegalus]
MTLEVSFRTWLPRKSSPTMRPRNSKPKETMRGHKVWSPSSVDMMKKNRVVLISLWEALAEELVRFPSPNLPRILKEVTEGGLDLLNDIQSSVHIPTHIKGLHETHRGGVFESTKTLEDQASLEDPHTRVMGFETRYTDLMVIKQYKRTYSERLHELEKTGRTHAELVEEKTKVKCERIWTEQLFRKSARSETHPHIVVVSGVAGIGKTTMVQKIMFDWARGSQYQRFAFVFLFKFRELNLLDTETEPQMPLTRLIVRHYKYLNDPRLREILKKPESLLFIFDGLDEYKHKLDFTQSKLCSNPEEGYVPVHILFTSLVRRTLMDGCTVLITSRPTTLEALAMERVDRFAEILGFFPEQRLMYFQKFFGDADQSTEAFQYVEENAILYTMCFNPSYCWIICSVLKSHFMTPEEERGAAPRTITELFVIFLYNILTNHKREAEDPRDFLVKLGKMAYHGVVNRSLVFYENQEMSTFGLRPVLSSPFLSGFLKEILQRESTLEHTTYTFYHLTIQEFMAACFFYLDPSGGVEDMLVKLESCKDGRFEILTRFLAGLARPSVFKTLGGILGEFKRKTAKRILEWVKQKAEQALWRGDKSEALRVCQWLYETQNKRLIRDAIGKDLKMDFSETTLSPLDCAVLGSIISCCGEVEELKLFKTQLTSECIRRLMLGLICCRQVKFDESILKGVQQFTRRQQVTTMRRAEGHIIKCEVLTLVFLCPKHQGTLLRSLSRAFKLGPSLLVTVTLHILHPMSVHMSSLLSLYLHSFDTCGLTSTCCSAFSSALSSPYSRLTELDLSFNSNLGDSGVNHLCEGLRSENCKLETLNLSVCRFTSRCCSALSSALSGPHSRLTELDLTSNNMGDSGVDQLCEGLRSENCKLEKLHLSRCGLTSTCCSALSSTLSSPHSRLTKLNLNRNNLEDSGVDQLCEGLRSENCKIEKLGLHSCGLTSRCSSSLSSVLSSPHSQLTELNLNFNKLGDSGTHQLCEGLRTPNCKLEILELLFNGISESERTNLRSLQEELNKTGRQVNINTEED